MARTSKVRTEFNYGHVAVCDNCLKAEFISEVDRQRIPDDWLEISIKQQGTGKLIVGDLCSEKCLSTILERYYNGPSA